MAYRFEDDGVASVQMKDFNGDATKIVTIPNINATVSADSLVAGLKQYLGVVGLQNAFYLDGRTTRVVTQRVVNS